MTELAPPTSARLAEMLADAGFGDVTVHQAPGDPTDGVFVASRPTT